MRVSGICFVIALLVRPSLQCFGGGGSDNSAVVESQRESRRQELRLWCNDNCVSEWGFWSQCTKSCAGGTQTRTRELTDYEWCSDLGSFQCLHAVDQTRSCNEGCSYGGTAQSGNCVCPDNRKGLCCEQERTCNYPGRPINGAVSGSWPAIVGSIAEYNCEDGFELQGDDFSICTKDGWDNQQPICERRECSPPELLSEHVRLLNEREGYVFGDIVMYGCEYGYELVGPELRECVVDPSGGGRWDAFDPVCEAVRCDDPGLPLYGSRDGYDTTFGSVMTFECDSGYKLVGTETLTCLASGNWLGHFPVCEELECDAPNVPDNGRVRVHRVDSIPTASFICDDGYLREGPESIYCGDFGEWDEEPPSCEALDCGTLLQLENGWVHGTITTFPNNVTFHCNPGYRLDGASEAQCLDSGIWSSVSPVCVVCPPNTYFMDGECQDCPANSHTATEGSTTIAQCECDYGYEGEAGAECVQIECMELDPPNFGFVLSCERTVGGQCSFTCNDGYVMERGTNIRTCQVDGVWDGEHPFCGPCQVDTYKKSERSCAPCPEYSHTESAAQMLEGCICDAGFTGNDGGPCSDVDECLENPCEDACENNIGSFACRCTIPGKISDPSDFTRCVFEEECRNLTTTDAPDNGGLVCYHYNEENSKYCSVRCNIGYDHIDRANNYETCGPVTGYTWSFQRIDPTATILPCIPEFFPGIRLQADIFYLTSNCKDLTPAEQLAVKIAFAGVLNENGVCLAGRTQVCNVQDMTIVCGAETRRKRRDAEDEIFETMEMIFNITEIQVITSQAECGQDICDSLNIPPYLCEDMCMMVYKQYIKAALLYTELILKSLLGDGDNFQNMTIQAADRIFTPKQDGVSTSGLLAECESGMAWTGDSCLACPAGTYLDSNNQMCVACPVMTYQDQTQQEECLPCPVGSHNDKAGLTYCLVCNQGKYGEGCAFNCDCVNGGCEPVNGNCTCLAGYEGDHCDTDIPGCRDQQCAPGVNCYDVPAPETGITCGPCPSGSHGDGFTCTPNAPGAVVVAGAVAFS